MFTYGAYHVWNDGRDRVEVSGCASQEVAFDSIARMLRRDGWKLPKWWHFWRWNESTPDWLKERFK